MIYDRQKDIPLNLPGSALVVGIGGVGAWVALFLALSGVESLILVDPDLVEDTNLNRTPFTIDHIGQHKVEGMLDLILSRREDADVRIYTEYVENIDEHILSRVEVVFDCRDNSTTLPYGLDKKVKILGGYDGHSITIHCNPTRESVWGDEVVRYTITPSWLIPPVMIASILVGYVLTGGGIDGERVTNATVGSIIKTIIGGK